MSMVTAPGAMSRPRRTSSSPNLSKYPRAASAMPTSPSEGTMPVKSRETSLQTRRLSTSLKGETSKGMSPLQSM